MNDFLLSILSQRQVIILSAVVAFGLTFLLLKLPLPFLPRDQGRKFAINGELSKGKLRGVGLVLTISFIITSLLFLPLDKEYLAYCALLFLVMLGGYLDDSAEKSWSDYKKGLVDFALSVATMVVYVSFNPSQIMLGSLVITMPAPVFCILGVIVLWIAMNVTNCSDGVDGLCGTVGVIILVSFMVIFKSTLGHYNMAILIMIATLLGYLYFNTSPSSMLMGDAGSRMLGFFLGLLVLKTQHPITCALLAMVFILDGGSGLVKIFLKRFLKISILKNTRTPLHDHARKNKGWSDTQVVFRFAIFQGILALLGYFLMGFYVK